MSLAEIILTVIVVFLFAIVINQRTTIKILKTSVTNLAYECKRLKDVDYYLK
jgi:hypothetical protein